MKIIWQFTDSNWHLTPYEYGDKDKNFIIENLGYEFQPNLVIGDEMNFVAIFKHTTEPTYLFRLELEGLSEIFQVLDLPGFFEMHKKCSQLIQDHFNTLISIEALKDD